MLGVIDDSGERSMFPCHGASAEMLDTHVLQGGRHVATVPVKPAPDIQDLTGAGGAFNAGFLSSYLHHGWDPEANVRAAHALARRVLRSPGATESGHE